MWMASCCLLQKRSARPGMPRMPGSSCGLVDADGPGLRQSGPLTGPIVVPGTGRWRMPITLPRMTRFGTFPSLQLDKSNGGVRQYPSIGAAAGTCSVRGNCSIATVHPDACPPARRRRCGPYHMVRLIISVLDGRFGFMRPEKGRFWMGIPKTHLVAP